jgi:Flp pilus assembly protein TadG
MVMPNRRSCSDEGRVNMRMRRAFSKSDGKRWMGRLRDMRGEEGASLLELALVFAFVYIPMLIGLMELAIALYAYNFVSHAARQATRYASVRGAQSCAIASNFPDCNLSPSSGSNPSSSDGSASLQTYIRNMGYPGIDTSQLTVTATWQSANITNPGDGTFSYTDWNTQCTTTDLNGNVCNTPGNAVKVVVSYPYTVAVPFIKNYSLNLSGTSQMVINE